VTPLPLPLPGWAGCSLYARAMLCREDGRYTRDSRHWLSLVTFRKEEMRVIRVTRSACLVSLEGIRRI